jgi:vacuolar-type H+-ATPase subunit E/Vma4
MSDTKYDKIKHLVEVEDDILAVFTITPGKENEIENLSIAKNANITRNFVDNIFNKLQDKLKNIKSETDINAIAGLLKWTIYETDRIRILIIYEMDWAVIVLIKSNTSLSETVDIILGYYYEC